MKALGKFGCVFTLVMFLSGCGSGGKDENAGGGGGSGQGSNAPVPAGDCLAKSDALGVRSFSSGAAAVEAFADAAIHCGASAAQLKARAIKMQQAGVTIDGGLQ